MNEVYYMYSYYKYSKCVDLLGPVDRPLVHQTALEVAASHDGIRRQLFLLGGVVEGSCRHQQAVGVGRSVRFADR